MTDFVAIRARAIAEILQPTLEMTQQFLKVVQLQKQNGQPVIAGIRHDEVEAIVYFRVCEEKFFLAVYLDVQVEIKVRWTGIESGSRVSLFVHYPDGHAVTYKDLFAVLSPVERHKHGFRFEPIQKETETVENKIAYLLQNLEPHKQAVRECALQKRICLSIAYYGYQSQMWGVHFEVPLLRQLADLNIEVDLDLYAGGGPLL